MPNLNTCSNCRAFFDASEKECPHCGTSIVPKLIRDRGGLVDRLVRRPGGVTIALIGVNVLLYAAMLMLGRGLDTGDQIEQFGATTWENVVDEGEWYRLVCAVFLHFSIWHILFNCYALHIVGHVAERFYGPAKFLAIYVLMGVIASAASLGWHGDASWIAAGASGAIMGVMGLLIAFAHRRGLQDVKYLMIKWAVFVIGFGFLIRSDNAAHIAGLIAGVVLGFALKTEEFTRLSVRAVRAWDAGAILSALVVLVCFGFALVRSGVIPIGQ